VRPDVLIIARSGRQLATAAARAGHRPAVVDFFGDEDTRAVSAVTVVIPSHGDFAFPGDVLIEQIRGIFATYGSMPIVYGSGFEAQAHLLSAISSFAELIGCSGTTVFAAKDPVFVAGALADLGIAHPGCAYVAPESPVGWLIKHRGGCGGSHVRSMNRSTIPGQRQYLQPRRDGKPLSVVFTAGRSGVRVLGLCESFTTGDFADDGYTYSGAVSAPDSHSLRASDLDRLVNRISDRFQLRGLCGIDMLMDRDGEWCVLEINPRPTATFDLVADPAAAFRAHLLDMESGDSSGAAYGDVRGSAICFADRSFTIANALDLPAWCADRPRAGTRIEAGSPICTVYAARAGCVTATRTLLRQRLEHVRNVVAPQTLPDARRDDAIVAAERQD